MGYDESHLNTLTHSTPYAIHTTHDALKCLISETIILVTSHGARITCSKRRLTEIFFEYD
jgi:hypothetical protein